MLIRCILNGIEIMENAFMNLRYKSSFAQHSICGEIRKYKNDKNGEPFCISSFVVLCKSFCAA